MLLSSFRLDNADCAFTRILCVDANFAASGKLGGNSCLANSSMLIAVMRKPCFGAAARFKLSQSRNRERDSGDAGFYGLPYRANDGIPNFFDCHH